LAGMWSNYNLRECRTGSVRYAGSLAGAVVLYLLGKILKTERLKKLFSGRFGRILHLKPEYVDKASAWFCRYQNKAVLTCRCIPLVRSLISIPAGINEMNISLFLVLTAIGSVVWNTALTFAGAFLGSAWETALPFINKYSVIIITIFCLAAITYVVYKLCKWKSRSA
jgi:membrane protein DedA with SNARE-associated domain